MIDRFKRNGADLVNLFAVPILIAAMPWRIGFRVLKWMARRDCDRIAEIDQAWQAAVLHLVDEDAAEWKWRFRLLQLLERVDVWLVLLRSSRWWKAQIHQKGQWPDTIGPGLLLTYHWGGGQWIWRQLSEHGVKAHFVARRAHVIDLGAGRIALWYAWVRQFGLDRQGCEPTIFAGGGSKRIRAAFDAGHSVVGMLDLPAADGHATLQRPLLDGTVAIPFGLAKLAIESAVPVVLFSCSFDVITGKRLLTIEPLERDADLEAVATRYIEHLDHCLECEPAFWQLWSSASRMFVVSNPTQGT
ncbi:MAG: hypothetical protein ABI866_05320 [Dokdonella sp.]